ncbi:MAG: helix-turn-helix domain-containing protein, partial [Clostridia bacterium]|nr:helix-turn-helix domain-containing protein [Clostridia bacterium]
MGFAERLKELRNENQCTQKKLAAFLGLTPNTICEWEKNRSEPSIETIVKLSSFFEVSAGYLLGLEDDFGARSEQNAGNVMHAARSSDETRLLNICRTLSPEMSKKLWSE